MTSRPLQRTAFLAAVAAASIIGVTPAHTAEAVSDQPASVPQAGLDVDDSNLTVPATVGLITGGVQSVSGLPVVTTTVTLAGAGGDQVFGTVDDIIIETLTDGDGRFTVGGLSEGAWNVTAVGITTLAFVTAGVATVVNITGTPAGLAVAGWSNTAAAGVAACLVAVGFTLRRVAKRPTR